MEELQLTYLNSINISQWDFARLKDYIQSGLEKYKNIVYDDERAAKRDKSELNKIKTFLEDKRKAYKTQCLAPYEEIEPLVKEIVGMIDDRRNYIDVTVKEYQARFKEEKKREIKAYYDKKSAVLGEHAQSLFDRMFDPKWLNKTTSKNKYEEEVTSAINRAKADIELISTANTPFVAAMIEEYVNTLSVEAALNKNKEIIKAASQAGIMNSEAVQAKQPAQVEQPVQAAAASGSEDGTLVRVFATRRQMEDLIDYMNAVGIRFEVEN